MAKKLPKKKPSTGRKPGNQPGKTPVVTPEMEAEIGRMWLRGNSYAAIGERLGVSVATVRYHLDTKHRPAWKENLELDLGQVLDEVNLLRATAWDRFEASQQPERRETLKLAPEEAATGTREQIEETLAGAGISSTLIERAVTSTTSVGDACWLELVKWSIDYRTRIAGWYKAEKMLITQERELRVAGMTPDQLSTELAEKVAAAVGRLRQQGAGS